MLLGASFYEIDSDQFYYNYKNFEFRHRINEENSNKKTDRKSNEMRENGYAISA